MEYEMMSPLSNELEENIPLQQMSFYDISHIH